MKIVSLKAENIKRLVAVNITPKGDVIKITGKNANGKSSVLDSIWMALGGGDVIPGKPIRDGQEKAVIEVDLGDMKVIRKFTKSGSTLTVEGKDGAVFRSPQSILDGLIGRLAFDPMAFMRLKSADQFRELALHAGIDFAQMDGERKIVFNQRTDINRALKQAIVEQNAITVPEGAPDEIQESGELLVELNAGIENNRNIEKLRERKVRTFEGIEFLKSGIVSAKEELKKAQQRFDDFTAKNEKEIKLAQMELDSVSAAITASAETDVTIIRDKLMSLESRNNAARSKQLRKAKDEQVARLAASSEKATAGIEAIDVKRESMVKASKLPVVGLGFGEDCVTYNGIPMDQASSAEQLRISVAVAMSMNPKLRVIRIQDGSLLDSDSMRVIEEMAAADDFQFWIEQVDESGKVGVVIADGAVASDNQ